jgi:hypothetical protein
MVVMPAAYASGQEYNTEIQGFYQSYRNLDFRTGLEGVEIEGAVLQGGGFTLAQNLAPWFAFCTEFTFYGSAEQNGMRVRIFNNLYGLRYQTQQYGPLRLYAKVGLGYSNYNMDILGTGLSNTKFSFSYGGGAQVWMTDNFGIVLDAAHSINGVPNLTDLPGRDSWDSGLTLSAGLAVRF